ncbi:MAG: hypothetical protein H7Y07_05660 [Pyrinomonadaceae bacterium]|nr:hypothetical protein [Sphingobacteriaceae bacterium]
MMRKFTKTVLILVWAAFVISSCKKDTPATSAIKEPGKPVTPVVPTGPRIIYVSAEKGDDASANPFNASTPYKTIQKAANITIPGDEVQIMSGTYIPDANDLNTSKAILDVTRSGTASAYITYKLYPGASAVIHTYGRRWNAVVINASYIKFDGIEVKGNSNNTPTGTFLEDAKASQLHYRAGGTRDWSRYSEYCTNGISVGGQANVTTSPHHVEIRNCKVHDLPGGGDRTRKS